MLFLERRCFVLGNLPILMADWWLSGAKAVDGELTSTSELPEKQNESTKTEGTILGNSEPSGERL